MKSFHDSIMYYHLKWNYPKKNGSNLSLPSTNMKLLSKMLVELLFKVFVTSSCEFELTESAKGLEKPSWVVYIGLQ